MHTFLGFHDSCIKEIKYLSGAYVNSALSMYPINDCRTLNMIIQRQFKDYPVIELEFTGLKFLRLIPVSDQFTCEILEATMTYKDGYFFWYDFSELSDEDLEKYEGTVICAAQVRWRPLECPDKKKTLYTLSL